MKKPVYCLAVVAAVASMLFTTIPLFASDMDDSIESSAQKTYVFRTYLADEDIKINSKDGLVTLTGTVQEASHKSLAGETVAGLPGVKGVENKLEEKGDRPAEKSDAWLITKVKTTLLFHRNVSTTATEVFAQDGTITLRGEADNDAQKDLTTEYALDVDGVKNVINEMTVLTAAMQPNEKTTGEKIGTVMKSGKNTMSEKVEAFSESIDDASITAMVKTTLLYHRSTSAIDTKVETKNGVVTLGGTARTSAEKDLAGKYTSDVNGVNEVNNDIVVE